MADMLKDSRTASYNFRLNSQSWDGVPKPKFLYYIRFVRLNQQSAADDWSKGIGVLAKDIDRPKVSFETETLNQYNKKRVIQKRVEYEPISFTFHDTVDNRVLHMFEDYFRFYYGDPRNLSALAWSWDIMASTMQNGQSGWGFIPPGGNTNNSYFFSHIEIYTVYGGVYSRYDIVNPKVKTFSPSNMAYDDSNGAEITMTLDFEGLVYMGNNLSLASQAGLLQEMGLSASGFYEPRTNSGTAILGAGQNYTKTGQNPNYNGGDLYGTNNSTTVTGQDAVTRSSALLSSNSQFNSIFTGSITMLDSVPPDLVSGNSTIGDNIAKHMVDGMKR